MQLSLIDWMAVALYFLFNIGIGLYYRKRATASTEDYFVGGWLKGVKEFQLKFKDERQETKKRHDK